MKKFIYLVIVIAILSLSFVSAALTDNLVNYYALDNNLTDATGNNDAEGFNHSFITGKVGTHAIDMNGIDSAVNLTIKTYDDTIHASFSVWVYFDADTVGLDDIFYKDSGAETGENKVTLFRLANKSVMFQWVRNNIAGNAKAYTPILNNDVWYHLVATHNGTNREIKLYFNGQLTGTDIALGDDADTNMLELGSAHRYAGGAFTNRFANVAEDEVGIWSRVLTPSEVTALYNSGCGFNPLTNQSGVCPSAVPTAPTVNTTQPVNNTLTNTTVDVQFSVIDENATVGCSVYVDNVLNQTNSSVLNNTATTFVVGWLDGTHTWYIDCTDTTLNGTSGIFNYYQDTEDPQVMSSSPLPFNTTIFTGYTMNIYGNATNINLSNVSITISYPNSSLFYANETTSFADPTTHTWNWTFDTTTEPNGEWQMYIYAEDNVANTKEQYITFAVNNCVTDWQCSNYAICNASDLAACNETTDLNNCSIAYSGDYSEFADQPCDYCSPDWQRDNQECINRVRLINWTDNNFATCCNITSLSSDCDNPYGNSEACGGYTAEYDSDDVAPAVMDTAGIFILIFVMFVPFVVTILVVAWGWEKIKSLKKK